MLKHEPIHLFNHVFPPTMMIITDSLERDIRRRMRLHLLPRPADRLYETLRLQLRARVSGCTKTNSNVERANPSLSDYSLIIPLI